MKWALDRTHDPGLLSWVESPNDPAVNFPIQNLPFCVFGRADDAGPRIGTAIGTQILDLRGCQSTGVVDEPALLAESLDKVMALPRERKVALRLRLSDVLSDRAHRTAAEPLLTAAADAIFSLPVNIGDYTDF